MRWVNNLARAGWYSALLLISYLALAPSPVDLVPLASDKFKHLLAFFVLLALFDLAYPRIPLWRIKVPSLAVYGLLIELVQSATPNRVPELADWFADLLGMVLYLPLRWAIAQWAPSLLRPETG